MPDISKWKVNKDLKASELITSKNLITYPDISKWNNNNKKGILLSSDNNTDSDSSFCISKKKESYSLNSYSEEKEKNNPSSPLNYSYPYNDDYFLPNTDLEDYYENFYK